ncbi:MAG: response regulator [Fidelibacterota bacterium]
MNDLLAQYKGTGKYILIVEDDPSNQKFFHYALNRYFDICLADSFETALDQLNEKNVEVIILDLAIHGEKDGLELTRHLRASEKWNVVPILAVTAHVMKYNKEDVLRAGCNMFFTKPIDIKELSMIIHQYL